MARESCCDNVDALSDDIRHRFLPIARLHALAVSVQNVHRLRPRLPEEWPAKCRRLRPIKSSYGKLYQQVDKFLLFGNWR